MWNCDFTKPWVRAGVLALNRHQSIDTCGTYPLTYPLKQNSYLSSPITKLNDYKLKLEDLNWDHSFVREFPGDPRTDIIPPEVSFAFEFFIFCVSILIVFVHFISFLL